MCAPLQVGKRETKRERERETEQLDPCESRSLYQLLVNALTAGSYINII